MEWVNKQLGRLPVMSWCAQVETSALKQAADLANHPVVVDHVALMPDCHVGYGMPIGGVVACADAVIPNAVGVDIGCGMCAVETDFPADRLAEPDIRELMRLVHERVPVGEGCGHGADQEWEGFDRFPSDAGWLDEQAWRLALRNLGTLGGGNHFIEIQRDGEGCLWLMIHTGSRNLGYRIASYYHGIAGQIDDRQGLPIPSRDLAYLPFDTEEGRAYVRDMNLALEYARENRRRIMAAFKSCVAGELKGVGFKREINIHHNYAAPEEHGGRSVWVHRKGATSAAEGEWGIIPGSMGTSSYVVKGRGNADSFRSCSHGAGRVMGRMDACRRLTREQCDRAMQGVVFDGWGRMKRGGKHRSVRGLLDLGEAPLAYKDIDQVIAAQQDLVDTAVRMTPLGVVKG